MGAGERGQGLDGAERVRVALVRLAEQPVALRGVVPHAGQGAADLAQGFVLQGAAAAALHQAAGLAEAGGGVVEVDPAAFVHTVRQPEFDVLDAALEAVERITGQGVGAGGGDAAEGARGHTHAEPACGEALGEAGTRPELLQRARAVGATGPAGALLGDRTVRRPASRGALLEHGLERGHQLGPLDDLDLRVELRLGQRAETGGERQQARPLGRFRGFRGRWRSFGLLGRRALLGLLLQGLGEGVRPPVRRYVRDHWRHLLSS